MRLAILPRRSHARAPRFAAGGGLLLAATFTHGVVGAGLALAAVGVVLEGLVPPPGLTYPEADDRFCRLVRRRRRATILRRLRGRPAPHLAVLPGDVGERHAVGVQPIAVVSVTGTVEPAQARLFDDAFRPHASAREHWKRIWVAQATTALPPVAVYRVGTTHYVIDGHHRVSAARERGWDTIEADVIELRLR
jgi:hypothetical protein